MQYVLLEHATSAGVHWDLMIEDGVTLATWRLAEAPTRERTEPIAAERIGPHRLAYLDYEGPISGERGHVRRCDRGEVRVVRRGVTAWEVEFLGTLLCGRYRLGADEADGAGEALRRLP